MTSGRSGMTLIELLMVITIIALLIGLLLPALALLKRNQATLETRRMLGDLGLAVTTYLQQWPRLGDGTGSSADDFSAEPLRWLAQSLPGTKTPLYAVPPRFAARRTPTGWEPCALGAATMVLDAWGRPLQVTVTNGPFGAPANGYAFADLIELRSNGASDDPQDDLIRRFSVSGDASPRDGVIDPGLTPREWIDVKP